MFVYEQKNAINVVFKGNKPVETPDFVIKGYKNGAAIIVNGDEVIAVQNAVEFDKPVSPIVFQRDNVLNITYQGIEGMKNPEVTINEIAEQEVEIVANGANVVLQYTEDGVVTAVPEAVTEEPEETPESKEEPVEEDIPEEATEEE